MSNRCLTLTPNSLTRVKAVYRQVPVYADDFRLYLRDLLRTGGFSKFNERADELFATLGSTSLRYMQQTGIGFKFIVSSGKWGQTDLYTELGELLCRVPTMQETANFLFFHAYDKQAKLERIGGIVNDYLMRYGYKFDAAKASELVGIDIPASARGLAPDYRTVTALLYMKKARYGRIRVKLTGVHAKDEALANAKAKLAGTPQYFTWHHLDDWDPVTGECTMQLVAQWAHGKVTTGTRHIGGTGLWRTFYEIAKYASS